MTQVYKVTQLKIDSAQVGGYSTTKVALEDYFSIAADACNFAREEASKKKMEKVGNSLNKTCYRASKGWDYVHWFEEIVITKNSYLEFDLFSQRENRYYLFIAKPLQTKQEVRPFHK